MSKPNRPRSALILFSIAHRDKVEGSFGEKTKQLISMWSNADDATKKIYQDMADEEKHAIMHRQAIIPNQEQTAVLKAPDFQPLFRLSNRIDAIKVRLHALVDPRYVEPDTDFNNPFFIWKDDGSLKRVDRFQAIQFLMNQCEETTAKHEKLNIELIKEAAEYQRLALKCSSCMSTSCPRANNGSKRCCCWE